LKLLFKVFIFFSIGITLNAQPQYGIEWTKTLDNGSDDRAYGIAVDESGNIYVTGSSGNGAYPDWLTIKYDSLGNIVWADTIDNGYFDEAYSVAVDASRNFYVTGYSHNFTNWDWLTVKYDSLGNIIWTDRLDNGSNEIAYGIALDGSGNAYVTGFGSGSNFDYLTVKYNSLGNILWADTLDNGSDDGANGIAVDTSGNIYVTGYSEIGSNFDWLTVKYNSLGNIIWADTLDNGSDDGANGIAVDTSGNIYVTGGSYIGSNFDWLTVKYDSLGNILWADTLYNGSDDGARGIAVDESGNIYVTGFSLNGTDYDYFTVKYAKYKDAGILSITSPPDTICIGSIYSPQVLIKNNSYEDTLSINIVVFIDSAGSQLYSDLKYISNLLPGDSAFVTFNEWTAPSNSMDLTLSFSFINFSDMNPANDTLSKTLYVRDLIPPVLDSAVAFDGVNAISGIDDDDYVILYFSDSTNKPTIGNTNINNVLNLSGGHSWLDGFGALGTCYWNPGGTQLLVNLTTNISPPTIAVDDTITADGVTITDLSGNPCSSSIVLGGSFDPTGIADNNLRNKTFLNVYTIYKGKISFSYGIVKSGVYNISLYSIDGRVIKRIEGKEKGYYKERISNLPSGIYIIRLKQGNKIINKKVVVIR